MSKRSGRENRSVLPCLDIPAVDVFFAVLCETTCVRWLDFTGYQIDGDYRDYTLLDQRYRFPIHGHYDDTAAAPSRGAMARN